MSCVFGLVRAVKSCTLAAVECVVLGYGGMMPMPLRMTTSVLVRRDGRMLLLDAGEGIQLSLKRGGLGIRGLDAVALTHLHADHVLGLPGIMMFRAQCDEPGPLMIVGPPGIERFVRHTLDDLKYHINFNMQFTEWNKESDRVAWTWNGAALVWEPLEHSAFCLGYRVEEPERPGRFDPERATALGVPPGPLRGRLQAGETVDAGGGRLVAPEEVLGPRRRGRIAAFATDTRPCDGLRRLCAGADLAFVEGMFADAHREDAVEKRHMTAAEAARVAADAGVGRLVLVHVSPRYTFEDERTLAAEAGAFFARSEVAKALETYAIPLPD
jgi:ribonuclease Z